MLIEGPEVMEIVDSILQTVHARSILRQNRAEDLVHVDASSMITCARDETI